jgi:ERF superfamily
MVYDFNIVNTRKVEGLENVTEVEAQITLIDLDSGESKIYNFFGQGQDKGDKGIYKAYTGLQKYFFMKNFLISTGDDPENDSGKANQTAQKTTTATARKSSFVPPTRTSTPALTTPPPTVDNSLTVTGDQNGNLTGMVATVPGSTAQVGVAVTADTPTNVTTTAAPVTAAPTTTTVKKPRGHFNPPKRTPKPAREE